jgi:hypothetical protein
MIAKIDKSVLCLTELGYCFFHNGAHLLKIPKKTIIEAMGSEEKSLILAERYPAFFSMSDANQARSAYERSVLEFTEQLQQHL